VSVILDTNVVSDAMRPTPDPAVSRWLRGLSTEHAAITVVTVEEVFYGLGLLPDGRRRMSLEASFRSILATLTIVGFDIPSATHCAAIRASRRDAGHPISLADAQIAGIVRAQGHSLATRNVRDFDGCGLDVVNPWVDPGVTPGTAHD